MLAGMVVVRRPGVYTFLTVPDPVPGGLDVHATIIEDEGLTAVVTVESARSAGYPVEFEAAWLTLDVHSALAAVGLTAAVSAALADRNIPCNMLAGHFHDHVLVPADRVDDASEAIRSLREA